MNNQDVPPKPASPPTAGLPKVPAPDHPQGHGGRPAQDHGAGPAPAPASVTWSQPRPKKQPEPRRRIPAATRRTLWKVLFAVVLLAVLAGLVWLAVWLNSRPGTDEAGTPGVLETTVTPPATPVPLPREGVQPGQYALGDCFTDFDPEALASRVVPCDTGHSAQLVAVFRYPEDASYPGAETLKAKALEACQAARLGPAANEYQLNYQRSFPSSTSWDSGDRRVDCYVTAAGGNIITASVLP